MIIPFYKIPKGSDIILYGCGKNGKECYQRIIKTNYCNLVSWVDQDSSIGFYKGVKIDNPDIIVYTKFDYVLISVANPVVIKEIRIKLIDLGIDTNKIIDVNRDDIYQDNIDYTDSNFLIYYIKKSYAERKKYARYAEEYFPLIEKIVKLNEGTFVELLKKDVFASLTVNERIILILLLYHCDFLDHVLLRLFMIDMLEQEWVDDTFYGLIMESMIMSFLKPKSLYKEFYHHRRKLMKKLCKYYELDKIPIDYHGRMDTVAIIARRYTPLQIADAPSRLVRDYALSINDLGYKVYVYILCSEIGSDENKIFVANNGIDFDDIIQIDNTVKERNDIHLIFEETRNIKDRMQHLMFNIQKSQPCFILDMSAETFVQGYELIKVFPIIHYPMWIHDFSSRSTISIYPSRKAFYSLAKDYVGIEDINPLFLTLNNLGRMPKNFVTYNRNCFSWEADDFIIISVGARLNEEISNLLISEMINVLTNNPKMKWILVGQPVEKSDVRFENLIKDGRIVNWGYEENLRSLYKICNLYLNPNRLGGGVSIVMALLEGIPVVMLDNGAGPTSYILEKHLIKGDEKALSERVQLLCRDKKAYNEMKESILHEYSILTFEESVKKILEIGQQEAEVCWEKQI